MNLFKTLAILSLVALMGCVEDNYTGAVLVSTDANKAPYSVKILQKTQTGYLVEVYSNYEKIEITENQIIGPISNASDEFMAVRKWEENQENKADPVYNTEQVQKTSVKQKFFFFGLIPFVLIALCYANDGFALVAIPYVLGACMVGGIFTFVSILLFFTLFSTVAVLMMAWLLGGGNVTSPIGLGLGMLAYTVFMAMFLLS